MQARRRKKGPWVTAEHEGEDDENDEEEGDEEVSDAVKEEDGEWSQFVKESSSGEIEWRMEGLE